MCYKMLGVISIAPQPSVLALGGFFSDHNWNKSLPTKIDNSHAENKQNAHQSPLGVFEAADNLR